MILLSFSFLSVFTFLSSVLLPSLAYDEGQRRHRPKRLLPTWKKYRGLGWPVRVGDTRVEEGFVGEGTRIWGGVPEVTVWVRDPYHRRGTWTTGDSTTGEGTSYRRKNVKVTLFKRDYLRKVNFIGLTKDKKIIETTYVYDITFSVLYSFGLKFRIDTDSSIFQGQSSKSDPKYCNEIPSLEFQISLSRDWVEYLSGQYNFERQGDILYDWLKTSCHFPV